MGFLDSLKKATRIGLSHDQFYNLAFEQGVLINRWDEAANLFAQAGERYQRQGNLGMAHRAYANQALYLYAIAHHKKANKERVRFIDAALPHLQSIPEIEVLGSQTDGIPTQFMIDELQGYKSWILADAAETVGDKVRWHTEASQSFQHLGESTLVVEREMSAQDPCYFHLACAAYYQAHILSETDPQAAVEKLQEAFNDFQNCRIPNEIADKVLNEINELSARETCWFCGRELQGQNLHFRYYRYHTTPYEHQVFDSTVVDGKPLTRPDQGIPLCVACGSAFETLANDYAQKRAGELREEVAKEMKTLKDTLNNVVDAVNHLQRVAHHH